MTYCRQGHTLIDNEAEAGWDRLPPATFFELVVSATTFFGIVDEYTPPTPTTLVCRLYTDAGRTILHTAAIATGVPYEISNFVDYLHDAKDVELNVSQGMGVWRSPPVTIRDDTGVWNGQWIASPRPDETVEFNFDGAHTLFKTSVQAPLASEIAGAGLGAGTYTYCIVPVDGSGRLGAGSRTLTVTLAGAADILIDWLPDTQVSQWNVYGRTSAGLGLLTTLPGSTVSYTDNGTDVPNTGLQPPLFEDPAWTSATANKEVAGVDDDVVFTAEGTEDGSTKLDDGSTVGTYTAIGVVDAQNTAESLGFDLTDLVSHNAERVDIVVDPNLFTEDTGPVEDLPPKVITYDYHVFINEDGDKVITETSGVTGQTTTITVDTVANTFRTVLTDSTGVLADDTITIPAGFNIPDVGSLSSQTTLSNFRTLADGTILADERIEANTYQVSTQTTPGLMFLTEHNFGSFTKQSAWSNDSGVSWTFDSNLMNNIVIPPGFLSSRAGFLVAHGEGWSVITSHSPSVIPSVVNDWALHWTNDLTQNPWPFNDAQGRVQSGNITSSQFNILNRNLVPTSSGNPQGRFRIMTFANGLGPIMMREHSTESNQKFNSFNEDDMDFWFPTTGNFVFQSPGPIKYRHLMYWREKNLLIGINKDFEEQILTNAVGTNPAAPLGPQSLRHIMVASTFKLLKMGTSRDLAWILYKSPSFLGIYTMATSTDGITWVETQINNTNDPNPSNPGNEALGLYPDEGSDPDRQGRLFWMDTGASNTVHVSTDAVNFTQPVVPGPFGGQSVRNWESGSAFDWQNKRNVPVFWDGSTLAHMLAASPVDFTRMNSDFTLQVPSPGGSAGMSISFLDDWNWGYTVGNPGSPNGIPSANLRRYLGRSAVIPLRAVNPPRPFVIRDTTKSAVYSSTRTESYALLGGSMRATITSGPGGLGGIDLQKYEDGQNIIISIPPGSAAYAAAKEPIPTNMEWSAFPFGTFE